jgi:hypothetical protein
MSTDVNELLSSIKNKKYYTVELYTEGKLSFRSDEPWPYDTTIKDNTITMTVLASTQEEANMLGTSWIKGLKKGDNIDNQ